MNTTRGGEPGSGAQRLGEPGPFEPGVDHLITALTTRAHPHELAGRDAAVAAFRAAGRQPEHKARPWSALSARLRRPAGTRRPARLLIPVRLAVAAASALVVLAGLTAAAAAQALPAPVEQIAYHVLAPLGVPVSQPKPGQSQSHPRSGPTRVLASSSAAASAAPSRVAARATPTPTDARHARKAEAKAQAKPKAALVIRPVLSLVTGKISDRLAVFAPSDKAGATVNLVKWTGAAWKVVAAKPLGPKHRAVFVRPAATAAGHTFEVEFPRATGKVAYASLPLWIPRLPRAGAKSIEPSPGPTTTASTTPDASATPVGTPVGTATPAPSTTALPPPPTGSPTPASAVNSTPGGSQTPSPSPTASAKPGPDRSGDVGRRRAASAAQLGPGECKRGGAASLSATPATGSSSCHLRHRHRLVVSMA